MAASPRAALVVEDDPILRESLVDLLHDTGYQVLEAADGDQALATLAAHAPASHVCMILLDLMLPKLDGLALLGRLRAEGYAIPVVALSANARLLAQAIMAGARDGVPKPFDVPDLLAVLDRCCSERHA
jgi:CheY-like chemotaxis protein